jgi:hypothetical protein
VHAIGLSSQQLARGAQYQVVAAASSVLANVLQSSVPLVR